MSDEQRKTDQQRLEREWMASAALRDDHRKAVDAAKQAGQFQEAAGTRRRWREADARCKEIEAEFRVLTRAVFLMQAKP